jgi:hypothetical protein
MYLNSVLKYTSGDLGTNYPPQVVRGINYIGKGIF